jgi:hypothetical protein
MPHLDDGTLHAYLDDALPLEVGPESKVPRGRGAEPHHSDERSTQQTRKDVDQHLNECAECRAALEDARRVKNAAASILSSAEPANVTMPSFDELKARAEAAGHISEKQANGGAKVQQRRLRQMRSLAWAATVALAAAVGWYARSAVLSSGQDQSVSEDETAGRLTLQVPRTESVATEADIGRQPQRLIRGEPEEETVSGAETMEGATRALTEQQMVAIGGVRISPDRAADTTTERITEPAESAGAPERPKGSQDTVDLSNLVRVDSGDRFARAVSQPEERLREESPQARRAAVAGAAPAPLMAQVAGGRGGGAELEWMPVDEATAAAILQEPIPTIEGLSVIGYATSWLSGQQAVKIQQALDSGNLVDLIVISGDFEDRADADKKRVVPADALVEADTDSVKSHVVLRGNLSIRISAHVSTDSLRVLGAKIPHR